MWQTLFAAAVAASTGLIAGKHIFKPDTDSDSHNAKAHPHSNNTNPVAQPQLPPMEIEDQQQEGAIFRFSSEAENGRVGSDSGLRLKKRTRSKKKNRIRVEVEKCRRVGVCLKKRKTGKSASAAAKSDTSLFNWGLNVGIMYMMSAGKAEINKLNTTMDETARIVQELKSELRKRKSSQSLEFSSSPGEANTNHQTSSCKLTQPERNMSNVPNRSPDDRTTSSIPVSEHDGECASSIITEEQEPHSEIMDMDQLEAELESELQKLPWCEDGLSNMDEDIVPEVPALEFRELEGNGLDSKQFHGVLPAQLDQKLCHVLIEQQEGQIVELESELHSAQSKLQEKETELQALKDCVRRLTDLSVSNISDDENEAPKQPEQTSDWNYNMEASESIKPTVGMKRPIGS